MRRQREEDVVAKDVAFSLLLVDQSTHFLRYGDQLTGGSLEIGPENGD